MEAFEITLTGSDGDIAGIVTQLSKEAYQFTSFDDTLHLTIAKNEDGKWIRLSGTEPYFSGWVDELSEKVAAHAVVTRTTAVMQKKSLSVPAKKSTSAALETPAKVTSAKSNVVKKTASAKKTAVTASASKKDATSPIVKKTKPTAITDKKTTVAASAGKKPKVSSTVPKGK